MGGLAGLYRGAGGAAGRAWRRPKAAADRRRRRRAGAVGGRARQGGAAWPAARRIQAGFRAGPVDRGRSRGAVRRQPFARRRTDRRLAGGTGAAGGLSVTATRAEAVT